MQKPFIQKQLGPKIKDTSLVLMKTYIFICARVQRKNKRTFSNYTFSNYTLLVTHKEKCQSRIPVSLKKPEFTPASVQAGSCSRTFHPEATGAEVKVKSKKTIPVETQTPTLTNLQTFSRKHAKIPAKPFCLFTPPKKNLVNIVW